MTIAPPHRFSSAQQFRFVATLFLVSTLGYADRNLLSVVMEAIRREFNFTDTIMGVLMGAPFAIVFALVGIPVARFADLHSRKTVLILCLGVWSVATALCGVAGAVWMLIAARMLVGAGEAGMPPVSHALVADYCPPEKRSRAYAALTASSAIGGFVALTLGGLVAGRFGWRAAFIGMGAASLPVMLLAMLVLVEPRRGATNQVVQQSAADGFARQVRTLVAKRSYLLLVTGVTIYGFVVYGPLLLAPTYMIRVLHVDVARAGLLFGPAMGLGTLVGSVAGGWLGDRFVKRDMRWLARIPAAGLVAALPMGLVAFRSTNLGVFVVACTLLVATLSTCLPAIFAAVQAVCGTPRRGFATAILFGLLNMVGMTIGPLLTGWLSSQFAQVEGVTGLRSAILLILWLLAPAGAAIYTAGFYLKRDLES